MTAAIVPFPARRMVDKARRVAAKMLNGGDAAGRAYDRRTRAGLRASMMKAGFDEATIEGELRQFVEAVVDELRRQSRSSASAQAGERCL